MDRIQRTVNEMLANVPADILSDLLDEKLGARGIALAKEKRMELAKRILRECQRSFRRDRRRSE